MKYRIETAGASVDVRDGYIAATGSCRDALTISCPDGELRPGLINSHDHLHRNHYPRLGRPPYADAYEWGRDIHARDADAIAAARELPLRTALLYGAFRNAIGGVTCVVHHDRREPELDADFPIRVPRVRHAHSPGFDMAGMRALAAGPAGPFTIHVAEGTTAEAAAEIDVLEQLGLLRSELLAVHCVAVDPDASRRLARAGAAVVWCPSSNLRLLGRTCARALLESCDVLIGTDSMLSADGTMLDELRVARRLGLVSSDRIDAAVGPLAARRLGFPPVTLAPGSPADLLLLRRPLAAADVGDVVLVTVAGRPLVADEQFAELFRGAGAPALRMSIGGVARLVSRQLAEAAAAVFERWPDAARITDPSARTPARPSA